MTRTLNYKVIFERDEDGMIIASVPSLPGCHSFASTMEEAEINVLEAMEGYIEALTMVGDTIPQEDEPTSFLISKSLKVLVAV